MKRIVICLLVFSVFPIFSEIANAAGGMSTTIVLQSLPASPSGPIQLQLKTINSGQTANSQTCTLNFYAGIWANHDGQKPVTERTHIPLKNPVFVSPTVAAGGSSIYNLTVYLENPDATTPADFGYTGAFGPMTNCTTRLASSPVTTTTIKMFNAPGAKNPTMLSLKSWYSGQLNQFIKSTPFGPCGGSVTLMQSKLFPNWAYVSNALNCTQDLAGSGYVFDGVKGWNWVDSVGTNMGGLPSWLNVPKSVRNGNTINYVIKVKTGSTKFP